MGQYDKAVTAFQQALAHYGELRDRRSEAGTLINLGYTHFFLGRYEKALECYERSLTVFRELKNRTGEAILLNNIGEVYLKQGQFEQARAYLEALPIIREVRGKRLEAGFL